MNNIIKEVYFWKTHTNQQIDLLEIGNATTIAYKTDWEKRKKVKFPKSFIDAYPEAKTTVINRATYWKFLTQKS